MSDQIQKKRHSGRITAADQWCFESVLHSMLCRGGGKRLNQ